MPSNIQVPSERHFRFHRRQWIIYLMGCTAMAIGAVAGLMPGYDGANVVLIPTAGFFGLMIALGLLERVRHREEYEREKKRILTDEWMLRGMNRSLGFAFRTVILGQVPLMFFVAYVPPEPSVSSSVVGMGVMTVALGCAVWAAGYLYHTRENPDG
jgi:uncharacterized membrane protein YfcA